MKRTTGCFHFVVQRQPNLFLLPIRPIYIGINKIDNSVLRPTREGLSPTLYRGQYEPILVSGRTYIGCYPYPNIQAAIAAESYPLFRVLRYRAPSSPIHLSEVIRFSLRLIASISLIPRRERCPSREEKSAFPQWYSSIYARSLKDQARQSKYPRTQILEPRTQSKLICHSSTTFIPTQSNNLIQFTSQSYIGISPKLYSFLRHPIQLYPRTHIGVALTLRLLYLYIFMEQPFSVARRAPH